jgi:hypothetical protein
MVQSRFGVAQLLEDQVHLPAVAIPRFIQTMEPLPPLSLMVQSQLGGTQLVEAQVHLPTMAYSHCRWVHLSLH